jgi:hypothetical protein
MFDRFITPKTRPEVIECYRKVSELVQDWEGVSGVISSRMVGYKTNYYFVKARIGYKYLTLYIRSEIGLWRKFEINASNDIVNYISDIKKAYNLSIKPKFGPQGIVWKENKQTH